MNENDENSKVNMTPKTFEEVVGSYIKEHNLKSERESFADLLEAYDAGMKVEIRVGDSVEGEIISIGMDAVFVNTGTKIDGSVDKAELIDKDGNLPYRVGDVIALYVVSMDENEIRLSKALSGVGGISLLRDAFQSRVPIEGKVLASIKGGFQIEILKQRAFCPVSQMDTAYVQQPEDYVGQVFSFLITRFEENGKNIVVSRRDLLLEEQEKAKAEFLENLSVDQTLDGRISRVVPFGLFVELAAGVEGMVHLSELGWSRVEHPEDFYAPGDRVTVRVIDIRSDEASGKPRIALSIKQMTQDPWMSVQDQFKEGQKIRGKVTRLTKFGAFVEIAPGIEGLVHISEMSYTRRVLKPSEIVEVNDETEVMIKEIKPDTRRISLSIRDAEGDPWIDVERKYPVGKKVEGIIEKKEAFGIFVILEPGITGLLPKSRLKRYHSPAAIDKLKTGDAMHVVITQVQPEEKKLTLDPADASDEDDWKAYSQGAQSSLGSLGEILQKAMKDKEGKR